MLPFKVLFNNSFSAMTNRYCLRASSTALPRISEGQGFGEETENLAIVDHFNGALQVGIAR